MDLMRLMVSKAGPNTPFSHLDAVFNGKGGQQMPHMGALSGMRPPQPMPQPMPMPQQRRPGFDWRQMMARGNFPMGFSR